MKHERAMERSKGDIGGPALPMNQSANTEDQMQNSMPDTDMGDLQKGYCGHGSIAGATKSTPGTGD